MEKGSQIKAITNPVFDYINTFISSKMELRFNLIKRKLEYRKLDSDVFKDFSDRIENSLFIEMKSANMFKFSRLDLNVYLNSEQIPYFNPYQDYFDSLPEWDGVDYVQKLTEYISVEKYTGLDFCLQLKKWLVRAVACCLIPDYVNKQMLVFVGEDQNKGKTYLCRWFVPKPLKPYLSGEITTGKDESIQITSNYMILLDEIAKLGKVSLEEIKALFSKSELKFRMPYGRYEESFSRTASFIGTSNYNQYLTDETGSIRFLNFRIIDIDMSYSTKISIDALYSQIYYLFTHNFNKEITIEEGNVIQEYNKTFFIQTSEYDFIQEYLRKPENKDYNSNNTTVIYQWQSGQILQFLQDNLPNIKLNSISLGKALKVLGYEKRKVRNKIGTVYAFEVCINYERACVRESLKECFLKK